MRIRFSKRGGRGVLPLFLILVVLPTAPLWATGEDDAGVYDAKAAFELVAELVGEKRYDEAIELLVEIGKQDPEQMERIQKRVLDIQAEKDGLNGLFARLTETVSAGDIDESTIIIDEIKEKFPHLNRKDKNRLILALSVVGKVADDTTRDDFFRRGNARLAIGDYRGAVSIYREGFDSSSYYDLDSYNLYIDSALDRFPIDKYADDPERQELIWEVYGTIAPEGGARIAELGIVLDAWDTDASEMAGVLAAVLAAVRATEPANWAAETSQLSQALSTLDVDLDETRRRTSDLDEVKNRLYAALEDAPEEFYYERIGEFITGRTDRKGMEGIVLAQEMLWESAFIEILSLMSDIMEAEIARGRTNSADGFWAIAEEAFVGAAAAGEGMTAFAQAAAARLTEQEGRDVTRLADALSEYTAYEAYAASAIPLWIELNQMTRDLPRVDELDFNTIDIARVDELADPIQGAVDRVGELRRLWNTAEAGLAERPGADAIRPTAIDERIRADLSAAESNFREQRLGLYVNAIIPLYDRLAERAAGVMAGDFEALRTYAVALPERHPTAALEDDINPSLAEMNGVAGDISDFLDVLEEMLNRVPPIADPTEVVGYRTAAENLLVDLVELRNDMSALEREARQYSTAALNALARAENALDEARGDINAARTLVDRGLWDDAAIVYGTVETSLQRVEDAFGEIRLNDIDIADESGLLDAMIALRDQANAERSDIAVTVKRNAVNQASGIYNNEQWDRLDSGIAVLEQAQEFWIRSYDDADGEMGGWLARLLAAKLALSQTVINPTDPLFSEMNQYLNLANRYYTNGLRLVADGEKVDSMLAFDSSEALVDQVLSVFPGNESALLLKQRIQRETDYGAWSREAEALVRTVRQAVVRGSDGDLRQLQAELYPRLVVLVEIDPEFPGLDRGIRYDQGLVYDVEVFIGIAPEPPDPRKLAESRRLTQEALTTWNRVTPDMDDELVRRLADAALVLLDEAVVLDLNNQDASRLQDEIRAYRKPASLPVDLQKQLVFFDQFFAEGDFATSRRLMDRMLGDYPSYANHPAIVTRLRGLEARE